MSYNYYNQFNLSNELAEAISYIISQKEGINCVCTQLIVEIPEHKEKVLQYPINKQGSLESELKVQLTNIKIPKRNYAYIVIINNDALQLFKQLTFNSQEEIELSLANLSMFYSSYDGIFNSREICTTFPYLNIFFKRLDEWRANNDRVTLDNDVLNDEIKKASIGRKLKY